MNTNNDDIKKILQDYRQICVIGLSPDPFKPSHSVPMFMASNGYEIVGVYPGKDEIKGHKIYPTLADVPADKRTFVNVFRRSEKIPEVVDEVIRLGGTKILWLQLGISHPEAEKKAEDAGILVVSNRCLLIEYRHLM